MMTTMSVMTIAINCDEDVEDEDDRNDVRRKIKLKVGVKALKAFGADLPKNNWQKLVVFLRIGRLEKKMKQHFEMEIEIHIQIQNGPKIIGRI